MWEIAVFGALLVSLVLIAVEDFQTRTIKVWKLIICALLSILYSLIETQFLQIWQNFLFSALFIITQVLLVMLYFSLKKRKLINIVDTYLGLGDILFFILAAFLFSFEWFIIFYFVSLLAVLLITIFYSQLHKNEDTLIPLAGGQAICLILLLIWGGLYDINFYENSLLWWWI